MASRSSSTSKIGSLRVSPVQKTIRAEFLNRTGTWGEVIEKLSLIEKGARIENTRGRYKSGKSEGRQLDGRRRSEEGKNPIKSIEFSTKTAREAGDREKGGRHGAQVADRVNQYLRRKARFAKDRQKATSRPSGGGGDGKRQMPEVNNEGNRIAWLNLVSKEKFSGERPCHESSNHGGGQR